MVATGPGVDTPTVGTRVTVFPNPASWAQRINVAAEVAVPVPDSVSDDVAAQMVCNPLTALLLYRAALATLLGRIRRNHHQQRRQLLSGPTIHRQRRPSSDRDD